jgi:hypothetical protein
MCFAYVLLVVSISFFAGMSALINIRSRQEARKLKCKNIHANPKAKRQDHLD